MSRVQALIIRTERRRIVVYMLAFHKEAECTLILGCTHAALALERGLLKHGGGLKLGIINLVNTIVVFTLVHCRLTLKFQYDQVLVSRRSSLCFLGDI